MTQAIATRNELLLPNHHHQMHRWLVELKAQAARPELGDLREAWNDFERELIAHMDAEEAHILPQFALDNPGEAAFLRDEHRQIREQVAQIGLSADFDCLRSPVVDNLVALLDSHANREDKGLYPWAMKNLPRQGWDAIPGANPAFTALSTLLDEVRVQAHLGGMEARAKFEVLRAEANKLMHERARMTDTALHKLMDRLRLLK